MADASQKLDATMSTAEELLELFKSEDDVSQARVNRREFSVAEARLQVMAIAQVHQKVARDMSHQQARIKRLIQGA